MRILRPLLVVLGTVSALVACTVEEGANPPATRDGTEPEEPKGPASLPPPSNPPKPGADDAGAEASAPKDDAGTLPNGPTSGIDPDKTIGSLSAAEKATLCDWQAGINGGYGRTTKCEGGLSLSNPKNQSACLQKAVPSGCQAKVSEVEACLKVDAADPCAFAILTAPECASYRVCAGL